MGVKIKGWEKLSGITYRGYCIVNPIHNAYETEYLADVLNLNLPQKPKWELSLHINNPNPHEHIIWLGNPQNRLHTQLQVQTDAFRTLSGFRQHWELLVERLIELENLSTPISSSFSISAQLYNMINTSSVHSSLYGAIKELEKQIEKLQKQ
jgi:hypothetical protein